MSTIVDSCFVYFYWIWDLKKKVNLKKKEGNKDKVENKLVVNESEQAALFGKVQTAVMSVGTCI